MTAPTNAQQTDAKSYQDLHTREVSSDTSARFTESTAALANNSTALTAPANDTMERDSRDRKT